MHYDLISVSTWGKSLILRCGRVALNGGSLITSVNHGPGAKIKASYYGVNYLIVSPFKLELPLHKIKRQPEAHSYDLRKMVMENLFGLVGLIRTSSNLAVQ